MAFAFTIIPASSVPPFEQIREGVVDGIVSGQLPVGTRLPTVRALAAQLGLAVNTVAKAYRALESEGHVETRGRHGTFILANNPLLPHVTSLNGHGPVSSEEARRRAKGHGQGEGEEGIAGQSHAISEVVAELTELAAVAGLSLDETIGLLRRSWRGQHGSNGKDRP